VTHGGPPDDRNRVLAAIDAAAARIRRDSRDARAWRDLGAAYFALGQFHDAEQALQRALQLDSTDLHAALHLAAALLELGRAREAVDAAQTAALAHPSSPDAEFLRGNAHAALGEHAVAADAFAAAIERDPGNPLAHYNRALALDELGRWFDAAQVRAQRSCSAGVAGSERNENGVMPSRPSRTASRSRRDNASSPCHSHSRRFRNTSCASAGHNCGSSASAASHARAAPDQRPSSSSASARL